MNLGMHRESFTSRAAGLSAVFLAALLAAAGCASIDVSDPRASAGPVARPGRIIVHDFAATPADLPSWAAANAHYEGSAGKLTADELAKGRELGAKVAEELVEQINGMGVKAVRAAGQRGPRRNDIVMAGYFATIAEGSRTKRLLIGFGSGAPDVSTHVEAYQMTGNGLVLVGSGETASKSGKGPGLILPTLVTVATANPIGLAVGGAVKAEGEISGRTTIDGTAKRTADAIADRLRQRFEQEGWI